MNKNALICCLSMLLFTSVTGSLYGQESEKQLLKRAIPLVKELKYTEAIPILEKALTLGSPGIETQYNLGKCYYWTYQNKKSLPLLEKAYKTNSDFQPDLQGMLARSYHSNLQFDKAIELYEKEKKRYPVTSVQHLSLYHDIANCKNGKILIQTPVDVKIENVGKNINTVYEEYAPVITADREIMYFTSKRPENLGETRKTDGLKAEDIYVSYFKDSAWTLAINMGIPINTVGQDAPISLSPDGHVIYIHRDNNGGDVYASILDGDKWSLPENLGEPINTEYWEPSVSVSADGNTLYFASNRRGGHGSTDLYVSHRLPNGKWSEGKNLGPKVNTLMNEDAPFIHPDGRTLYFSSQAHMSMGGFDIFKTVLLANGEWSKPVNIGYPINTPDDDIYFALTASGKYGYYASAGRNDGYGGKDIYRIIFPDTPADTTAPPLAFKPELSVTLLKGVVSDISDNKPILASLMIVDNEKNDTIAVMNSNKKTGKYLITLTPGKNYGIIASATGYLFCSENVDIPVTQKTYQEIIKNIKMVPLKVGSKIILKNIFFDFDKATLRPISKAELNRLVKILNDNPKMKIRIGGHTDNFGTNEYNQKLSENRSASVVKYLIENGIQTERLEYKGYGEEVPIDTNDNPQGRQNNRRTEFEILSN